MWWMFFSTKYAQASVVAPIMNLENFFTIIADIFFFQYNFVSTDLLGMSILAFWIAAPIVTKFMA